MNPNQLLKLFFLMIATKSFATSALNTSLVAVEKKAETRIESTLTKPEENIFNNNHRKGFLSPFQAIAAVPHTISEYEYASGSWFGTRDLLKATGIGFSITYISDVAGNPVGGKYPGGCTYTDNFAFACLLETEKLFGWHGGYFMISAIQRDGISLTHHNIYNEFNVQRVWTDSGETLHFFQLSYEQKFLRDRASLKLGRIAAIENFATSPLYFFYMNKGIDSYPRALRVNGNISSTSNAVWGSVLKTLPTSSTIAQLGIYQVTNHSINTLYWNFYPGNGIMLLGQYEWISEFFKPSTLRTPATDDRLAAAVSKKEDSSEKNSTSLGNTTAAPKGLTGHYWMGGYYSTWEYAQFNSTIHSSNAYALYWHADQMLYRPNPYRDNGLVLWSSFVLSPQENISLLPLQISGGAIYTGLIPYRYDDTAIFGFTYGNFSSSYAGVQEKKVGSDPTYELVYESGYRIHLTKSAYIQPDLQWVIRPYGLANVPNALVVGVQTGIVF